MDPEPEWFFWRRRVEVEFREGLWDMDSMDELLRERRALEKTRGFLPSPFSDSFFPL
jgi:hypothetical protein